MLFTKGVRTRCAFFAQTNDAKLDKGETVADYIMSSEEKGS